LPDKWAMQIYGMHCTDMSNLVFIVYYNFLVNIWNYVL